MFLDFEKGTFVDIGKKWLRRTKYILKYIFVEKNIIMPL